MLKETKVDSTLRGKKKKYICKRPIKIPIQLSAGSTLRELSFEVSSARMNLRTKTH